MSHIQRLPRFLVLLLAFWLVSLSPAAHAAEPREGLLIVAFGTSVPEAVPALKALDADFRAAFPDAAVEWAYTSQIIRKKLAERGTPVGGISDGLAALARKGVKVVRVQSLHVMAGEEFSALERAVLLDVKAHPGRFEAVYLGRPLLESRQDAREVAAAVLQSCGGRAPGEGLVLMGHGQAHGRADLVFEGMRRAFVEADGLTFMASVEGSRTFEDLARELATRNVKTLWVQPFMIGSGRCSSGMPAKRRMTSRGSRSSRSPRPPKQAAHSVNRPEMRTALAGETGGAVRPFFRRQIRLDSGRNPKVYKGLPVRAIPQ